MNDNNNNNNNDVKVFTLIRSKHEWFHTVFRKCRLDPFVKSVAADKIFRLLDKQPALIADDDERAVYCSLQTREQKLKWLKGIVPWPKLPTNHRLQYYSGCDPVRLSKAAKKRLEGKAKKATDAVRNSCILSPLDGGCAAQPCPDTESKVGLHAELNMRKYFDGLQTRRRLDFEQEDTGSGEAASRKREEKSFECPEFHDNRQKKQRISHVEESECAVSQ